MLLTLRMKTSKTKMAVDSFVGESKAQYYKEQYRDRMLDHESK